MYYKDRVEAGQALAKELNSLHLAEPGSDVLVLALPRGGVPVAGEVAKALGAPLDLLLTQKAPGPLRRGRALAMLVEGAKGVEPHVMTDLAAVERAGSTPEQVDAARAKALAELERRQALYRGGRERSFVEGRTVILVDDGADTGETMRAALRALRQEHPQTLIAALPVASLEAMDALTDDADRVVCLASPEPFQTLARHYGAFAPVSDDEIAALLASSGH